jgi:hypothetical protein
LSIKFHLQEATMKLNVLTLALAATVFTSLGAAAQTTIIEERSNPAVVIEKDKPATSVTVKERGGFLGTEKKTTTETTGTGLTGDCTNKTVHKEDLTGEKTVSKTKCD